jgi:hypothetical protein
MIANRRALITGLISFIAAPAIVRASSLMPVKLMLDDVVFPFPPPQPVWVLGPEMYSDLTREEVLHFIVDQGWIE